MRNRDTGPELLLRSALFRRGQRFRKNVRTLPGSPDVVFPGRRVVVFVDGDFWHGYRFDKWRTTVSVFWQDKIQRNIARDRLVDERTLQQGWHVIRIWEHEVDSDVDAVVDRIIEGLGQAIENNRVTTPRP